MDLFNTLGAAFRPLASQKKLFASKDHQAAVLYARSGEMCDACIAAKDLPKALKYNTIALRLISYRTNLMDRYPFGF